MSRLSILTAGLAVLLAGCATAPEPPQSPADLRSTHGFLRASLATGKDKPEPLKLRRISDGITVKLQAQPAHGRWSVGLWLPEGEYEFPSLVQANGQKYSPIRVERGRVTDLGAVLDLQVGGYEYLTVAIDHPEASADLDAALRELQPHLSNMEPLKWSTPSPPKPQTIPTPTSSLGLVADLLLAFERHVNKPPLRERLKEAKTASEAYRLALTGIAPDTDEPGIDAAGALYFGGALGQIRRRSPNGEWTNLDTGTLESITAVEVDGNRLMAGTSSGTIRVSDDGGVTWRRLVTLDVGLPVVDIDRVGLRWIVITEDSSVNPILEHVRDLKRLRVYSATAPTLVDLALVREARVGPGPIFTHWGMGVRGQAAEDGASYYVNGFTELAQISLTNLQWKTLKPPQSVVTRFGVSKDGRILTVLQGKGIASKLSVSTDGAQTWSVLEAPPRVALDAHFESLSDGHAVRVIAGMLSVKIEFLKYDPAANRWIMTHEAPAGCRRLLLGAENRQRFCVTSGGSVLDYADKQWKVEFANY